jgi:pimeloyl-ACP methyl ester carboxylesterase
MLVCKEETVTVRGRKTQLFRGGMGEQLLFLHDSFCPGWLPIHERLAAQFDVIVPIQPGFAGSEENFDHFDSIDDLLFHYLDLYEALQLHRPALAGASFGGWLAAEWAIRYGDGLSKLILIDALGLRVEDTPAADVLSLDGAELRKTIFADAKSALALATLPDTPKAEDMVRDILARRALARFAWQFPDNPKLRGYLYRVKLPTLILWGELDGYVSLTHANAYQSGIVDSSLETFTAAGHLPHVEAAENCAVALMKFLRAPTA